MLFYVLNQMETWKNIEGYDDYEVSSCGKIKSKKHNKERILKDRTDGSGYYQVLLLKNGIEKSFKVHKLVAIAFIPNTDISRNIIDHIDRCRTNNNISNLRWVTKRENRLNSDVRIQPMYGICMKGIKYKVQMNIAGTMTYLGCFKTLEEAQTVRDSYLKEKSLYMSR
jgi:hypothetical protein